MNVNEVREIKSDRSFLFFHFFLSPPFKEQEKFFEMSMFLRGNCWRVEENMEWEWKSNYEANNCEVSKWENKTSTINITFMETIDKSYKLIFKQL